VWYGGPVTTAEVPHERKECTAWFVISDEITVGWYLGLDEMENSLIDQDGGGSSR